MPFNDSRRQAAMHRSELAAALLEVLDGGWYIHGQQHREFERAFASYLGVGECVGVANGTDALELALRAVEVRPGQEVITVANAGFYASAAALQVGAVPAYVDVREEDALMDVALLGDRVSSRTGAVVVTHLYGRMAEVEAVVALCRPRGVPVVEDCAQSVGARRGGRFAGSWGDVATMSFYPTKNLGALGDGGAVVTSEPAIAARVRRLRQYGWGEKYRVIDPGGRNSRLDEMQAAVLLTRLEHLDGLNERRRWITARYQTSLAGGPVRMLGGEGGDDDVAHLAVCVSDDRRSLAARLLESGVQTSVHYPVSDHRQPIMPAAGAPLPVTERLQETVLSLPCFPELADDEVDAVCTALADVA